MYEQRIFVLQDVVDNDYRFSELSNQDEDFRLEEAINNCHSSNVDIQINNIVFVVLSTSHSLPMSN